MVANSWTLDSRLLVSLNNTVDPSKAMEVRTKLKTSKWKVAVFVARSKSGDTFGDTFGLITFI
jgi:hypothetical protein